MSFTKGLATTPDFRPSPHLYPFRTRWFESSVGTVHYIDEGQGRPILFSHGQPTWTFLYRNIILGLQDRFRCIAMDLPGFGLSERPDGYQYTPSEHSKVLGELVDELELDDLIVMGHDWGGPIVLRVAADRADRVSGVVLGNTWFWPEHGHLEYWLFSKLASTRFGRWQIIERNWFIEHLMFQLVTNDLSDEVKAHYRAVQATPELRQGLPEFPSQLIAGSDWLGNLHRDVVARLAEIPALIVWGMQDRGFANRFHPRVRATFSDHLFLELPEANHFIQEDAPDEIVEAIKHRFSSASGL